MRRSIATLCMSGTLRDKLEAAAAARFDAVELCEPDFIGFRGTPREVRHIADDGQFDEAKSERQRHIDIRRPGRQWRPGPRQDA